MFETAAPPAEALRFRDESASTQAERVRREQEDRDRELQQVRALSRARRRSAIVMGYLLIGVGVAAVMLFLLVVNYRELNARDEEIRRATERYQQLSQLNETSRSALVALEGERAKLKRSAATASPADQARLEQLTKDIDAARALAKDRQNELAKLQSNQKLADSDRGGLMRRIDSLQDERDQLRQQVLERAYAEGVRFYELRDFKAASAAFKRVLEIEAASRLGSSLSQRIPKEVRMSGTRVVPYAPRSYLAVTLYDAKEPCSDVAQVLGDSFSQTVPPEIKGRVEAADRACGT